MELGEGGERYLLLRSGVGILWNMQEGILFPQIGPKGKTTRSLQSVEDLQLAKPWIMGAVICLNKYTSILALSVAPVEKLKRKGSELIWENAISPLHELYSESLLR